MQMLRHTCDVYRNQAIGTNGRSGKQLHATAVACLALPMSPQTSIQNKFELGRGYDFYFEPTADIKRNDRLVYGGNSYSVRAKEVYDVPVAGHMHVLAEQELS